MANSPIARDSTSGLASATLHVFYLLVLDTPKSTQYKRVIQQQAHRSLDTGSALIEDDLPQRCYFQKPHGLRYTGESTGTALTRTIEELDVEESLTLQQDHEGNLILDTPSTRTAKEGMQDIGTTGNKTRVLNDATQTSKILKSTAPPQEVAVAPSKKAERSKLAETKPPQLTQSPEAQISWKPIYKRSWGTPICFSASSFGYASREQSTRP